MHIGTGKLPDNQLRLYISVQYCHNRSYGIPRANTIARVSARLGLRARVMIRAKICNG